MREEHKTVTIERGTKETSVKVSLSLAPGGESDISTGVPFLDHMLDQIARHGFLSLSIKAEGDTHIDAHHTVEDVGITLGEAFHKALGDRTGIKRFGFASIPLCEALSQVTVDLCSRPFLVLNIPPLPPKIGEFDSELVEEFLHAFSANAKITLHVQVLSGTNAHHIVETVFKGVGKAVAAALEEEPRSGTAPLSTKGVL